MFESGAWQQHAVSAFNMTHMIHHLRNEHQYEAQRWHCCFSKNESSRPVEHALTYTVTSSISLSNPIILNFYQFWPVQNLLQLLSLVSDYLKAPNLSPVGQLNSEAKNHPLFQVTQTRGGKNIWLGRPNMWCSFCWRCLPSTPQQQRVLAS